MKGSSSITILLLLILLTLSLVGISLIWFQHVKFEKTGTGHRLFFFNENKTTQTIKIVYVNNNNAWIKNTGNTIINTKNLSVYIYGIPQKCTWNKDIIIPGETAKCSNISCPYGNKIKVVALNNTEEAYC